MPGSRLVGISVRYAFWPPIKLSNYHQVPLIRDEAVIVTLKHSTIPRFFQDHFYAVSLERVSLAGILSIYWRHSWNRLPRAIVG
jgi:hypothetical protein